MYIMKDKEDNNKYHLADTCGQPKCSASTARVLARDENVKIKIKEMTLCQACKEALIGSS